MAKVWLHRGRDRSVRRRHPWVFSGAISGIEGDVQAGDIVTVLDNAGDFLKNGANSIGLVAPLFPADAVAAGNWDVINANAVKVMGNVKAALA